MRPLKIKFKDKSFFEIGLIGERRKLAYILLCAKEGRKATIAQVDLDEEQLAQIQDFIDKIINNEEQNDG